MTHAFNPGPSGLDDPLAPLLRVLADGRPHGLSALAAATGQTLETIATQLAALEQGGLALTPPIGTRLAAELGPTSCAAFDALDGQAIGRAFARLGVHADVRVRALTDSTNLQLLAALRAGRLADGLTVLASELQFAGRGRLGRSWHSRPGSSLTVSFALRVARQATQMSGLSLALGLAVREALARHGVSVELKWPNDLLAGHGKVGGMLIEVQSVGIDHSGLVIGVGLNISADADRSHVLASRESALPATDLVAAGASWPVDRNQLVADLGQCLSTAAHQFATQGFAPLVEAWNQAHAFQDAEVSVIEGGVTLARGIARGVDALGRLLLDTPAGRRTVVVGDVSMRPAP